MTAQPMQPAKRANRHQKASARNTMPNVFHVPVLQAQHINELTIFLAVLATFALICGGLVFYMRKFALKELDEDDAMNSTIVEKHLLEEILQYKRASHGNDALPGELEKIHEIQENIEPRKWWRDELAWAIIAITAFTATGLGLAAFDAAKANHARSLDPSTAVDEVIEDIAEAQAGRKGHWRTDGHVLDVVDPDGRRCVFDIDVFEPTVDRAGSVKIDQREGLCDEGFVLMRP